MKQTIKTHYTTLIPCRWGWFCGLTADKYQTHAALFQGEWGHDESLLMGKFIKPGDTVIDVGANVGALTLAFAAMVGHQGQVIAIEPQRYAFACLSANIALNSLIHFVTPLQAVVGDSHGIVVVPSLGLTEEASNSGGLSLRSDGKFCQDYDKTKGDSVQMITIDDMNLERLDFLKVDVEGMEPSVLRGAAATLDKCRPILWVEDLEVAYPNTTEELRASFIKHNYNAWKIATPLFSEQNSRLSKFNLWEDQYDQNVLAIPKEDEVPDWIKPAHKFEL